jgi:acyl-CoA reductase-like NAD-dependent aldehyde dehydrogenase
MTRSDSIYEVERLIEVIEEGIEKIREGVKGKPIGIWAVISEYNSPLAAPMGYAISAMLAGNTVIMIPPKECPFPSYLLYDILASAGLPDGVFNLIFDRLGKATKTLIENENLKGIVATGRGDRFEEMMFAAVDDIKVINEFKGMNPLLIYRPASMQSAADAAIMSAFGYSGQRIDSCSKVIITADEQRTFVDHLLVAAKKMVIGDPAEKETFAGPVISKASVERFLEIVKDSKDHLVFGGKRITNEVTEAGHYVIPAIFVGLPEDDLLNIMDNSLPILSVQVANDLDEAMEMVNDCELGSSTGIISKDERVIERFLGEADSDVVYVNGTSDNVGVAIKADVIEFLKK